jgi:predicted Zn-dependent peptidase
MGRESLSTRAEQAAAQVLVFGRIVDPADFATAIDAVTAGDIARLALRFGGAARPAVAVLGPRVAKAAAARFEAALAG